jgi:hypothetical protein
MDSMYPNSLQIFHFCCINGNEREKIKAMFAVRYLKENGHKFLFGNAGSNEKNNCKPDHNRFRIIMPVASKI